ncbi:MAG: TetR/AcrR family transcriptional regulator [Pseudomonadota bacterium]
MAREVSSTRRWSQEDWVAFALGQLREGGPGAVKLETICRAAGKTRGSFYAHFSDHNAFLVTVVAAWVAQETTEPLAQIQDLPPGEPQRAALVRVAAGMDPVLHRQVRRLAAGHRETAEMLEDMDRTRIAAATQIYAATLGFAPDDIRTRDIATLAYSAVVGLHMLAPLPRTEADWGNLFGLMARAYADRQIDADPGPPT